MARHRLLAIPQGFRAAIEGLSDDDVASRRTRAVARLLEAGLRPREIVELDIEAQFAASCLATANLSSGRIGGRKARVVRLEPAAAADIAAFLKDRRAGHGAVASSDIDEAVAAVSAKGGTKLRAHDLRVIAAIRIAEAMTDEERRGARRGLEDPDEEGVP